MIRWGYRHFWRRTLRSIVYNNRNSYKIKSTRRMLDRVWIIIITGIRLSYKIGPHDMTLRVRVNILYCSLLVITKVSSQIRIKQRMKNGICVRIMCRHWLKIHCLKKIILLIQSIKASWRGFRLRKDQISLRLNKMCKEKICWFNLYRKGYKV